MHSVAENKEQK